MPAISLLSGLAASAAAPSASAATAAQDVAAAGGLVLGPERRYAAPLLAPGTRLVLPAGIRAKPVKDYYTRPRLAGAASAWPYLTAADGSRVDASVMPERGAPTRFAVLSGFTDGWYEIRLAGGRADRVTWDASAMPFLWLYGEFGATKQNPYDRFYSLALQPISRNPYSATIR
ncbi:MAG TPA: hypothetical protein VGI74_04585 [Streptosporangiaceae bacterium]